MYQVIVWNELQQDFVAERDPQTKKVVLYDNEIDAMARAIDYWKNDKNVQAKVEYVRQRFVEKRTARGGKSGRIKRFKAVQMTNEANVKIDGDWGRIVAIFDAKGNRVKKESK